VRIHTFTAEQWLPRPLEEVFAFFSDAGNLDLLTPAWLSFQVLTPRLIPLHPGALIDYRLRWHGLSLSWRTQIKVWDPPGRFVDEQVKGPYSKWLHEHTFEEKDGGTLVRDTVDYAVPGWVLGPIVHRLFVGPDVRRIFAYRRKKLAALFGGDT
jgi:ligand-binding SRPBCC domain-containing protein